MGLSIHTGTHKDIYPGEVLFHALGAVFRNNDNLSGIMVWYAGAKYFVGFERESKAVCIVPWESVELDIKSEFEHGKIIMLSDWGA